MSIWFREPNLEFLNSLSADTMLDMLGIQFTKVGEDFIEAKMPVDHRTHQPFGILHGGASVVLAESLGSTGATLCVDAESYFCVGQEINANHIRPVRHGDVIGRAEPVHIGRRSQVWNIRIEDERERLVCVSRLTLAVLARDDASGT
ncbi:MAG: hotdog fold thioesterase [Gammaproteobacteria bacterium]